jgi:DNA-directed RNA polymerase subunit alpha
MLSLKESLSAIIKPETLLLESQSKNHTKVTVAPLPRGFGTTIGNALRRVLLSSLPGFAIVSIKVPGVLHEFAPVKGVREDMSDILLNLKSVQIKLHQSNSKLINLQIQGPVEVTAGMIATDTDVEIFNPDQVICNITDDQLLEMTLLCTSGRGYISADVLQEEHNNKEIGNIWIDGLFSPIEKVSFKIEDARVGQEILYDKMVMSILTNGSLDPEAALCHAAKILQAQLQVFLSFAPGEDIIDKEKQEILFDVGLLRKVNELDLSIRSQNCLRDSNIVYIGDLVVKTEAEILKTPNFGRKSLKEIKDNLEKLGFHLGMQIPNWPPEDIEALLSSCTHEQF